MNLTIKKRISWSFFLLVFLFFINAFVTVALLHKNRVSTERISKVLDPSIKILYEFKQLLLESKTYSINWVFLRSQQIDKDALISINVETYPALKAKMQSVSSQWKSTNMKDSLVKFYSNVEELIVKENAVMALLKNFNDYDNIVKRLEAERLLEDEILPISSKLLKLINVINQYEQSVRSKENIKIEYLSNILTISISITAIITTLLGFFLSAYLRKIILQPIYRIKEIIDALGKGVTSKVVYGTSGNEIAEMADAVNQLSEKLETTAKFAEDVGKRNFDVFFVPLSNDDTLGKAILKMRDELKKGYNMLAEAQHLAHLGSWELDISKNRVHLSDEFYSILEIERHEFDHTMEGYFKFIHPDDKEQMKNLINNSISKKQTTDSEYRIITKNKKIKNIYSRRNIVLDEQGNVSKLQGVVQDITEQKYAQLALEKANTELKTLFNNIDEVFFSVDTTINRIIQISPACKKVTGYEVAAFYKYPNLWKDLILVEDLALIDKNNSLMHAGKPFVNLTRIRHKDGSIKWVETKIISSLDETGKLVRLDGIATDITARKAAEETLIANNIELKKTNSELDKFVYSVSHDLRAPLTSMLGVIEISEEETEDTFMLRNLGMVKSSIHKLDGFIVDILDYSRNSRTEIKKEEIHFDEMLDDITKNLKFMGGNNGKIDIKVSISNGTPFVSDKNRISVLLNNLISNAIRYQNPLAEKPFVDIKVKVEDKEASIFITDNGIGIGKEYQQKVFDMFYRVSEGSIGSGLGLYIVKETIDKLHGHIELESELGKGTTFKISIPNN